MRIPLVTLLWFVLLSSASQAQRGPLDVLYGGEDPAPIVHGYALGGRGPVEVSLGGRSADGVLSPDGRRVAFVENLGREYALEVIGVDGIGRKEVARSHLILGPSWSPDGSRIIYVAYDTGKTGAALRSIAPDGLAERCYKVVPPAGVTLGEGLHRPHLGRDGSVLLTVRVGRRPRLLVVPHAGGTARFLCEGMDGVWSPDGTRLVYIEWVQDKWLLRLARADGTAAVTLPVAHAFSPVFSPDGRRLYFNVVADAGIQIWVADVDQKTPPHRVDAIPNGAILSLSARMLLIDLLAPH